MLPVIIFEDIKHVVGNRKGIFVCKRNINNFIKMAEFIFKNYFNIVSDIKKNILPTKDKFISDLAKIILSEV